MPTLGWILVFTLLGGALSALAASLLLLISADARARLVPHLIGFATGALLGAAFLGLLPRAVEDAGPGGAEFVGLTLVGGILAFFVLEKLVLWRHCHVDECEAHTPDAHHRDQAAGTMILVGDALHNALDGLLIAAAFLTDVHLGIVTSVAVIVHEIPQEIGDLVVLLHAGMSRARALWLNLLASVTSVVGGVVGYFWLAGAERLLPFALAVAASSFIYIAVADLIPGLHRRVDARTSLSQFALIVAGVGVMFLTQSLTH